MKAILLDGSPANDVTGERVRTAATLELQSRGWDVKHILLREKKIGNCAGDFFCWIRNPGVCNVADDNRNIAEAIVHSDLMVYLTPVTFGGYSSALKRMVDHQIQNVLPFFAQVNGETHHQRRYHKYANFLAIGWMETPNAQSEGVFRHLAWRNAINFNAKTAVTGLVLAGQTDEEIRLLAQSWLNDFQNGKSSQPVKLPERGESGAEAREIRRALLLVGSPRTRKSTSQSLGGYLFEKLGERKVQTETIYIHTSLRSPERMQALLKAVEAADLVTLAFPLYVDSLPAPVIEALERIAVHRSGRGQTHPQLFAAISNCGFPEAHHNATALAICENFARQAGFEWAGSLALGAGQGLVHGMPVAELDNQSAIPLKKALDIAAEALANGKIIPRTAVDLLAKPIIPGWLYRLVGIYGWRQQAKQYGMEKFLKRRPYLDAIANW
jgi:multimeric flavodoxin WrbA